MACLLFVSRPPDSTVTCQQTLCEGQSCALMSSSKPVPTHFTSQQTLAEPWDEGSRA